MPARITLQPGKPQRLVKGSSAWNNSGESDRDPACCISDLSKNQVTIKISLSDHMRTARERPVHL